MARQEYDVIIIGAGLGGLTCGALLAKHGSKVLLLEKNQRLGGYATTYSAKGHSFDVATQALGGCEPDGPVLKLLAAIGIAAEITFLPCEPARVYYFGRDKEPFLQHGNWQDQLAMLVHLFPEHETSLHRCYQTWREIFTELQEIAFLPQKKRAFGFTKHFPLLAQYGRATVQEFFDELHFPRKLQLLLAARSSYCLLPLDKLSLVAFACTETSYAKGAWIIQDGVKKLPASLAGVMEKNGSIIKTRAAVSKIHYGGNRVTGVTTKKGETYSCRNIVVGTNARKALDEWLPNLKILPMGYKRKLKNMEASGSYYVAYYKVPAEAVIGLHPNIEVRSDLSDHMITDALSVYYVLIPSLVDKGSAPKGYHSLCLSLPLPPGRLLDRLERKNIRQKLEKAVENKFPTLSGKLTWLFELSPGQLASMTGNPDGSAYGWSQTPEQSGIYRLNIRTPLEGLYLTGHWTMPGGGIAGVMTSGQLCAETIIQDEENI
jgi:prolycopene isomerase